MKIRDARLERGYSQEELAYYSLVSAHTISKMENGHPVSRQSFLRVCQALEVNPREIQGVQLISRVKRPA